MKRLVWLLLAVFGTSLAQVSPVHMGLTKQETCSCCEQPGACGMPDCAPPTAAAQPVSNLANPVTVTRVATAPTAPRPRLSFANFYAQFGPTLVDAPVRPVREMVRSAPCVPLFQEHCSLLL